MRRQTKKTILINVILAEIGNLNAERTRTAMHLTEIDSKIAGLRIAIDHVEQVERNSKK